MWLGRRARSRWRLTEHQTGSKELGQIRLVFLELPKYDASQPPETVVEKWAYFFREADSLTMVPEELAEHPFVDALEAARTAGFTKDEWDAYILAGIAIQNERGALAIAEKRGEQRGLRIAVHLRPSRPHLRALDHSWCRRGSAYTCPRKKIKSPVTCNGKGHRATVPPWPSSPAPGSSLRR